MSLRPLKIGNETDSTQRYPCVPGTISSMDRIRITIGGRLALTVEQAAERYHLQPGSMSAVISRGQIQPDATLDGKKKLYLAARLDEVMKGRPGKGSNLRKGQDTA
jgi:hypothetical protein